MNELLFVAYIFIIAATHLTALFYGKEALIGLTCIQAILVNIFVTKQIILVGLTASASDALAVGISLSLNLLQEYYSKEVAKRALFISFLGCLFYIATVLLTLAYSPAPTDTASVHLEALCRPVPRLVVASLITYGIVQYIDLFLYASLKRLFGTRFFMLKNYSSLIIVQFIDTFLFSFLGLYGINKSFSSLETLLQIGITSYIIKLIVIAIIVPFIAGTKTLLRYRQP